MNSEESRMRERESQGCVRVHDHGNEIWGSGPRESLCTVLHSMLLVTLPCDGVVDSHSVTLSHIDWEVGTLKGVSSLAVSSLHLSKLLWYLSKVPKNGVRQTDADIEAGKARDVLARSSKAASHTPDAGPTECIALFCKHLGTEHCSWLTLRQVILSTC